MRRKDLYFQMAVDEATDHIMREFVAWNKTQRELKESGYDHNWYDEGEMNRMRSAFQAIAERFVLEDIDCKRWSWFETPWAGADGNNGGESYIIDFVMTDGEGLVLGLLGFYVNNSNRFWHALPLAEVVDDGNLVTCEANDIQAALDALGGESGATDRNVE